MNYRHLYWRFQSKFNKICGRLLQWLPASRQKIVFNNFHGKGYGDSPKYIAEEIIRQGLPYDLVWLVNDMNMSFPPGIRKVSLQSARSSYELSTARVIVSNVKVALPYCKKKSQYYIQTWHGSMAFKAIEKDAIDKLQPQYVKESMEDSKHIDLFLSSNSVQTQEIQNAFWYDGEIFECGSPRNDMLYRPLDYQQRIKERLGVSGKKIVLYAPTFRDDFRTDVYNINLEKMRRHLDARFDGDWHVLVRLHPNVMGSNLFANTPNISDVTLYPDMQELLLIADVLVTDYSTIIYDEVIMDKLVLLYAPDLDDYKTNRGLKQIYFDLPTRICQTSDDLCNYIDEIDVGQYHAELRRFLDSIKVFDDGHASERVVERIASIITKD